MTHRALALCTPWCSLLLAYAVACSPTDNTGLDDPRGGRSGAGGGSGAAGGTGSGGTSPSGQSVPCEVTTVLQRTCHQCHGAVPQATPMSLVSLQDFHEPASSNSSEKVFQRAKARINDEQSPMPPKRRDVTPLSVSDRAVLNGWLDQGAPGGTACNTGGNGGTNGSGSGGSGGGTGSGGSSGIAGSSGVGGVGGGGPEDVECHVFKAHGAVTPGDQSPFTVGNGVQNLYQCFYFRSPWNVPVHALSFKSVDPINGALEENPVIHHWLLYDSTDNPQPEGHHVPCVGLHPDAMLLSGWAPGGDDWVMPADVGMELPSGPNATYMLEVHYYNGTGAAVPDQSGVEVCVTKQLRKNTATVTWLGTQSIILAPNAPGTAASTCSPNYTNGPITILRAWPHMHKLGRRMTTEITRAGGAKQMLVNEEFNFDYQYGYPMDPPVVLNQGDTLTTTCHFQNTTSQLVTFGPNTEQEMCYNFVVAYPPRALTSAGLMRNACEF